MEKLFASLRSVAPIAKVITEKIANLINSDIANYSSNEQKEIIQATMQNLEKCYNIREDIEKEGTNEEIVSAVRKCLHGLKRFGGKYFQVQDTVESFMYAISYEGSSNNEQSEMFQISRKKIAAAKERRKVLSLYIKIQKSVSVSSLSPKTEK